MKKQFLLALLFLISAPYSFSQCAMCRAVLESEGDGGMAKGINNGITYLMAIPYILVGLVAYGVYRVNKKKDS